MRCIALRLGRTMILLLLGIAFALCPSGCQGESQRQITRDANRERASINPTDSADESAAGVPDRPDLVQHTQPIGPPPDRSAADLEAPAPPIPPPMLAVAAPPTGHRCTVQFRRDALGIAAATPLGIRGESRVDKLAQVSGVIDQVTPEWLVLRDADKALWIPRSAVLLVEVDDVP